MKKEISKKSILIVIAVFVVVAVGFWLIANNEMNGIRETNARNQQLEAEHTGEYVDTMKDMLD